MKKAPRIAGNSFEDVHALPNARYSDSGWPATPGHHQLFSPDMRGKFAMECIARWGMVAGMPDGEDSAGRAKLRCLTPTEVATKACDCSDRAFVEFEKRGWLITIPALEEMIDAIKDADDTN